MGLDMYLSKRTYVKRWDHQPMEKVVSVTVTRGGVPHPGVQPDRVSYVIEEVMYWRKANAIHRWFVHEVQGDQDDCGEYRCTYEDLHRLLTSINQVLANPPAAETTLPTEVGFFFGNVDYDDGYLEKLGETHVALSRLLNEPDAELAEYLYQSSW